MYNRTLYNRTPYNRTESYIFEWLSTVFAEAGTTKPNLLIIRYLSGSTEAETEASGVIIEVTLLSGSADAISEATGEYTRILYLSADEFAESNASGTGVSTYGALSITISGINMLPGDELIIDTEDMTVTLNGVSIVDRLSDNSVFFKLMSGENKVIIEGSTAADLRILYKDRWL